MFIKQAYEDRLKKEGEEITASLMHSHTKAQPKVGSIKNTRINYDKDEHFFSKDDVPVQAQQIVAQVKEETDPDFLGLRKRPWNTSVFVPKNPLAEETFERKMIKIKLGMFDHKIQKYTEPKIYDGCETRDYYSGIYGFQQKLYIFLRLKCQNINGLFLISKRIRIKVYFLKFNNYILRTKKVMQLTKRKQAELITNYKSGIDRQNELTYKLREEKHCEKELRDQIKQEYKFKNPSASSQKIDAAVFRIAYERKNQKQVDDDLEFGTKKPFYPNLSKTLKHQISKQYYHSGIWQTFYAQPKIKLDPLSSKKYTEENSKDMQEQGKAFEAWSCCMNQDRDSEGCCLIKKDAKRWNYESIKHY